MENRYGIEEIQSLDFRTGVRERIQMYLGSDDTEGIYQSLKEIINNSTDEAIAGYGDRIEISIEEEINQVSVRDYGRGVPFGFRENGENVLVSIFTKSHTGGKFDKTVYKNSSGLNGIGASAACLSSSYFKVISYRDNKKAIAEFKEGELINYREEDNKEKNGTLVILQPDRKVFKNITDTFTFDRICNEIKNIAYLNKGVHFVIKTKDKEQEYFSKNGIADFILDKITKPLMKKPIVHQVKDDIDELEIAYIWTNDISQSYVFVNGLLCPEGGSPITGAKTAITNQIKKLAKRDFDPEVIRKGLVYAINCKVSEPSFANQTKSKINNSNLRTLAGQAFKESLEDFSKTQEFNIIIDMLTKVQKAEQAAEKAREVALQSNGEIQKELKKKIILADKLADSRKHDENSQLMICEGKSAKGALVKARNSETTACFDLRGKIINVLKNEEDRVGMNEEVKQLHIALGCGFGDKFNIKKLRYGRIVIMADMDKDGYSIVCLVLSFFYHFYPELIRLGKIYWGVTPLFKVEAGKKKYFAYDEEELKSLPKGDITRLKGLGESQPEDFRATIFSDNAKMIKITMNDAIEADKYFDILLGENITGRKEYIFSHANFEELED